MDRVDKEHLVARAALTMISVGFAMLMWTSE